MYVVDQPGIGGLEITEAGYLAQFGPGHFNFTFMLGEKGFNEVDMSLLKHLLFNNKPLAFVRTQCDSTITGVQNKHEDEVSFCRPPKTKCMFSTTRNYPSKMPFSNSKPGLTNISMTKFSPKSKLEEWVSFFLRENLGLLFLEIFYIGLPIKKFPDFKKLVEYILGGGLLKEIGEKEANEKLLSSEQ